MIPETPHTPFVGRAPLVRRLERMVRAGKHVLLVGPAGVGKSMLVDQVTRRYPMIRAPHCGCFGDLLAEVEPQMGLDAEGLTMAKRVHRAAAALPKARRALVLENVRRVPRAWPISCGSSSSANRSGS